MMISHIYWYDTEQRVPRHICCIIAENAKPEHDHDDPLNKLKWEGVWQNDSPVLSQDVEVMKDKDWDTVTDWTTLESKEGYW